MLDRLVSQGRWTEAKQAQTPMVLFMDKLWDHRVWSHRQNGCEKARCFGLNVIGYDPYMPESYVAGKMVSA